jgi:TRAP-type C4-dicarboxylate transport system permease small subunit
VTTPDPKHEPSFREFGRRVEIVVIGALVVLALIVFLYGSLVRTFAPAFALDWAEEVTIYLIIWATLLSGGTLASGREHVSAQIVAHLLSARARRCLQIGIDVLTLAFCVLVLWLGIQGVLFAWMLDERSASTLQAPQAWALYLSLPVSMLLIVVRVALLLLQDRSRAHG